MVTVLDVLEPTTRGDTPMAAERHADAPVTYTGAAGLLIDGYTPPVRLRQIGNVALTGRGLPMSPPLPHPMPRRARFKARLTQLGVLCGGGGTAWAVQDLVHADPAPEVVRVVILPEVVHLVAQLQTRGPEAATRALNSLVESEGLDHALEAEDARALDAGTSRSDADPARPRRRETGRRRRP